MALVQIGLLKFMKNKDYIFHSLEVKNVSPTLTCGGRLTDNGSGIWRTDGFTPILIIEDLKEKDNKEKNMHYKIRKLTPQEAFRLMGVSEENIEKMCDKSLGLSDNNLWKLAGNSIVVNSMEAVFDSMFIHYKDNGHIKPLKVGAKTSESLW